MGRLLPDKTNKQLQRKAMTMFGLTKTKAPAPAAQTDSFEDHLREVMQEVLIEVDTMKHNYSIVAYKAGSDLGVTVLHGLMHEEANLYLHHLNQSRHDSVRYEIGTRDYVDNNGFHVHGNFKSGVSFPAGISSEQVRGYEKRIAHHAKKINSAPFVDNWIESMNLPREIQWVLFENKVSAKVENVLQADTWIEFRNIVNSIEGTDTSEDAFYYRAVKPIVERAAMIADTTKTEDFVTDLRDMLIQEQKEYVKENGNLVTGLTDNILYSFIREVLQEIHNLSLVPTYDDKAIAEDMIAWHRSRK